MKVTVELFVIRIDGNPYWATPIQDLYDNVQISIPSEYFSDEDLNQYFSHFSLEHRINCIEAVRSLGRLVDEQEAKDFGCKLSRVSIAIETREIEIV